MAPHTVLLLADGIMLCSHLEQVEVASPDPGMHPTSCADADFGRKRGTQGLFGSAPVPSLHQELGGSSHSLLSLSREAQFRTGLRAMPGQEGIMFQLRLAKPTKIFCLSQGEVRAVALEQQSTRLPATRDILRSAQGGSTLAQLCMVLGVENVQPWQLPISR